MILPEGFVQTGGHYHDYVGAELSPANPSVSFSLRNKFVSGNREGNFQLLRTHKNADSKSKFIAVGNLNFSTANEGSTEVISNENLRIFSTPGYVPFLSADELRAGVADTARVVYLI